MMEVAPLPQNGGQEGGPRKRHNVAEWSRMDHLTGMLEHARVETDHWASNTPNTKHQYGKVVDRRARNRIDGSVEQVQQTKQLEVFQAHIPGGSLQVIRSQTSSWSNTKQIGGGTISAWPPIKGPNKTYKTTMNQPTVEEPFEDLQLSSIPLDLSHQKMKVNIGRSGSIGGRRPPTRPRNVVLNFDNITEETPSSRLSESSKTYHKLHRETGGHGQFVGRASFKKTSSSAIGKPSHLNGFSEITDSVCSDDTSSQRSGSIGSLQITEIVDSEDSDIDNDNDTETLSTHSSLNRHQNSSIDDVPNSSLKSEKTVSNASDEHHWRRSSKVRRSLQFPPQKTDREGSSSEKSVSQLRHQIEKKHEAFKQVHMKNWSDLSELEGVVERIKRDIQSESAKQQISDSDEGSFKETETEPRSLLPAKKKDSFITVESLNEVRGRLKSLNPESEPKTASTAQPISDVDDGIVTESKPDTPSSSSGGKVKTFVFGMEVMLQKPKINGTGSLESRSSSKSSSSSSGRSDEWHNRRKSYGFEQMHNQNGESQRGLKEESKVESSTDSGICRSSEIVAVPITPVVTSKFSISKYDEVMPKSIVDSSDEKPSFANQFGRKSKVSLAESANSQLFECHRRSFPGGKIQEALKSLRETSSASSGSFEHKRKSEPITISIPIVQLGSTSDQETSKSKTFFHRRFSSGTAVSVESSPQVDDGRDSCRESDSDFNSLSANSTSDRMSNHSNEDPLSEHSDSSLKFTGASDDTSSNEFQSRARSGPARPTSLLIFSNGVTSPSRIKSPSPVNESDTGTQDDSASDKKQRKVEFSKTEIHFAAEPGKLNIVETDGKPPPTDNYRRRRRHSKGHSSRNNHSELRLEDEKVIVKSKIKSEPSSVGLEPTVSYKPISVEEIRNLSPSLDETHNKIIDSFTQKYGPESWQESETVSSDHSQTFSDGESSGLRGILKSNGTKPEMLSLREITGSLEETTGWKGEKIHPEGDSKNIWCSSVNIKSVPAPHPVEDSEFQRLLKSLKPATRNSIDIPEQSQLQSSSIAADNGLEVRISSTKIPDKRRASWSVPDKNTLSDDSRLRGFSTKVNFGAGEATVVGPASQKIPVHGPTWFQSQASCDNRLNNSKGEESKLIVRIGEGSNEIPSCSNDLAQFSYNFNRFSSGAPKVNNCEPNANASRCKNNEYQTICDNLPEFKSTSLVMETMRSPTMQTLSIDSCRIATASNVPVPRCQREKVTTRRSHNDKSPSDLDLSAATLEVMNSSSASPNEDGCSGIPSVLSVLDDLKKSIDDDITEIAKYKNRRIDSTNCIFRIKNVFRTSECATGGLLWNPSPRSKNINCDTGFGSSVQTSVPSQLSLLKEILDNGELSDDSLKADEEVRSYMSRVNDEDEFSSEVSGSWSKVKAIKYNQRLNLPNKLLTTQTGDAKNTPPVHRVVATAKLDSYDQEPNNLQSVEALVSTKSGHPKITSISLKYNESQSKSKFKPLNFSNRLSKHSTQALEPVSVLSKDFHPENKASNPSTNGDQQTAIREGKESRIPDSSTMEIPIIVERRSREDKTVENFGEIDTPIVATARKKVLKSVDQTRMPLKKVSTPPRRISVNKKIVAESETPESVKESSQRHHRHRLVSPMPENNYDPLVSSVTKLEDKSLSATIKALNNVSISKVKKQEKSVSRHHDLSQKRREAKAASIGHRERKSIFESGRDSWLNAPKDPPPPPPSSHAHGHQSSLDCHKKSREVSSHSRKHESKRLTTSLEESVSRERPSRVRSDSAGTESSILEQLTKAADEILLAVNGCTDGDESDTDDGGRRNPKIPLKAPVTEEPSPLTISTENPPQATAAAVARRLRTAERSVARNLKSGKTSAPTKTTTTVSIKSRLRSRNHELEDLGSGVVKNTVENSPQSNSHLHSHPHSHSHSRSQSHTHTHSHSQSHSHSRGSKQAIEERNWRRQARVSQMGPTAGSKGLSKGLKGGHKHLASSSEDIESASENTTAHKVKRVVRKIKSQAIKTMASPSNPSSDRHKPRERVYPMDHQGEEKKKARLTVRENGAKRIECPSSSHRRIKPNEHIPGTDDLRLNTKIHSGGQKEPHRKIRGTTGNNCDPRSKTVSYTKTQLASPSK